MATHLAEVEQIAADPGPATFANTAEALGCAAGTWHGRAGVFFNLVGPDTNPKRNEIAQHLSTALTDHFNTIAMNPELFARISSLHERADELRLSEPQRRLLDKQYRSAVRSGAGLAPDGQAQMREILAAGIPTTTFSQLLLDDTNDSAVLVDDVAELDGLSAAEIAAAARAATEAGHDGKHLLALQLPTSQSVLASWPIRTAATDSRCVGTTMPAR